MSGPLVLVGGGEWTEGCTFDRELVAASGASEVVVIPAGSAYENPAHVVAQARAWFGAMGVEVREVPVLTRGDALVAEHVEVVRASRFTYLPGTSPMHLRSVLKDSPVLAALVAAWEGGGVLAGSGAGADVLCDPMVDTRGGAFTVGLGVVAGLTVIPRFNQWSSDMVDRTVAMAPASLPVVGIPEGTGVVRSTDGGWRSAGVGDCTVFLDGDVVDLTVLPA